MKIFPFPFPFHLTSTKILSFILNLATASKTVNDGREKRKANSPFSPLLGFQAHWARNQEQAVKAIACASRWREHQHNLQSENPKPKWLKATNNSNPPLSLCGYWWKPVPSIGLWPWFILYFAHLRSVFRPTRVKVSPHSSAKPPLIAFVTPR